MSPHDRESVPQLMTAGCPKPVIFSTDRLSPLQTSRGTTEFTLLRVSTPTRAFTVATRYMVLLAMELGLSETNKSVLKLKHIGLLLDRFFTDFFGPFLGPM